MSRTGPLPVRATSPIAHNLERMEFHINLEGRTDLSGAIYRQMRDAIVEGRLRAGDLVPPTRHLARRLGVARMTVTVAYERLVAEGFLTTRVGAGTFVTEQAACQSPGRRAMEGEALEGRAIWQSVALPRAFARPARYDFRTGLPDASMFPDRLWRQLIGHSMRVRGVAAGIYQHPAGVPELREAIARHVAISRGVVARPQDVTITNGTQQALDILARVLLAPGDAIALEEPGYQPPRRLFASLGLCLVPVPVDSGGLSVSALPASAGAVYVTPSHQYPLGMAMPLDRRRALLAWAQRNGAAIIEDDYDSEFRFGGRPLPALQSLDPRRVIYVGSFSKTLLPTLRLGFIVAPPSLQPAIERAKFVTDWHTATLEQTALARFVVTGGYARHVRRLNAVYRQRHLLMTTILSKDLSRYLALIPSTTGVHVAAIAHGWTPAEIDAVQAHAADRDVAVQVLSSFSDAATPLAGIVLGYGAIAADAIEEGLRRLRGCFRRVAGDR